MHLHMSDLVKELTYISTISSTIIPSSNSFVKGLKGVSPNPTSIDSTVKVAASLKM